MIEENEPPNWKALQQIVAQILHECGVPAKVEEKIDTYPEINRFGKTLPAYGIFARHVNGLTLKNVTLKVDAPDLRPALVAQDVQHLIAQNWQIPASADAECVVRLESSKGATIENVKTNGNAKQLVLSEGE